MKAMTRIVKPKDRTKNSKVKPIHGNYGYSMRFVTANKEASIRHIGVRLGRLCIKEDIPIQDIAKKLAVSRQSVYNWFIGTTLPHPKMREKIRILMGDLSKLKYRKSK